jgi:hypothetical protein
MKDAAVYKIHVKGHLSAQWADWFNEMEMSQTSDGGTCLSGLLTDQAALHGVLGRIRDLGLELISVERFEININPEKAGLSTKITKKGFYVRN